MQRDRKKPVRNSEIYIYKYKHFVLCRMVICIITSLTTNDGCHSCFVTYNGICDGGDGYSVFKCKILEMFATVGSHMCECVYLSLAM